MFIGMENKLQQQQQFAITNIYIPIVSAENIESVTIIIIEKMKWQSEKSFFYHLK